MTAAVIAHLTTTGISRPLSVWTGGRDVSAEVKWDSLVITDNGSSGRGTLSMRVERALADFPECYDQARVDVVDEDDDFTVATGYVISRRPFSEPASYSATEIVASDIGSLLDDRFIAYEVREAESMVSRIAFFWGKYAGSHLSGDMSGLASLGSTLGRSIFEGVTLREAIERTLAETSSTAEYRVDALGKLHVYNDDDATNPAPHVIAGHP
jgi:hypothetical protein